MAKYRLLIDDNDDTATHFIVAVIGNFDDYLIHCGPDEALAKQIIAAGEQLNMAQEAFDKLRAIATEKHPQS